MNSQQWILTAAVAVFVFVIAVTLIVVYYPSSESTSGSSSGSGTGSKTSSGTGSDSGSGSSSGSGSGSGSGSTTLLVDAISWPICVPSSTDDCMHTSVIISGQGFVAGATVSITGPSVYGTVVSNVTPTQITVTAITTNLIPGVYDVSVTLPSGVVSNSVQYTQRYSTAGPSITALSLAHCTTSAGAGSCNSINFTITGSNFDDSCTVSMVSAEGNSYNCTVTSYTATTINVTATNTPVLPADQSGTYGVVVTNSAGLMSTTEGFTVTVVGGPG